MLVKTAYLLFKMLLVEIKKYYCSFVFGVIDIGITSKCIQIVLTLP